ncbi:hypothetical protein DL771_003757 [Monosporascus sp. 5C6A]|nr:hypothetical protein DL771_003757 [Monosporascus sp. 5C6A]
MASKKPNFPIIEADDLGFQRHRAFRIRHQDAGAGQDSEERRAPDQLHRMLACSPMRSMLFSGNDNHITGLGQMAEQIGKNRELFNGKPRYESCLNFHVAAPSDILQDWGYLKPHIRKIVSSGQLPISTARPVVITDHEKASRRSEGACALARVALIKGPPIPPRSGNHYNYDPQFKESEPRPSLAIADPNTFWMRDGQYLNRWTELPSDSYSAKTFTDGLLNYFRNRTPEEKEKSFFSCLAYTARRRCKLGNTFILFISDDGAKGKLLEALPMVNGATSTGTLIEKQYDNSLENIGNRDSFTWYDANWACASVAQSCGFKTWITGGGCFVRYPPLTATATSAINGQQSQRLHDGHGRAADRARTRGDARSSPCAAGCGSHPGGTSGELHDPETTITGWELFGLRGIRQGTWKDVYMMAPRAREGLGAVRNGDRPRRIRGLAKRAPGILKRLMQHWNVYCGETGMFDPDTVCHVAKDMPVA